LQKEHGGMEGFYTQLPASAPLLVKQAAKKVVELLPEYLQGLTTLANFSKAWVAQVRPLLVRLKVAAERVDLAMFTRLIELILKRLDVFKERAAQTQCLADGILEYAQLVCPYWMDRYEAQASSCSWKRNVAIGAGVVAILALLGFFAGPTLCVVGIVAHALQYPVAIPLGWLAYHNARKADAAKHQWDCADAFVSRYLSVVCAHLVTLRRQLQAAHTQISGVVARADEIKDDKPEVQRACLVGDAASVRGSMCPILEGVEQFNASVATALTGPSLFSPVPVTDSERVAQIDITDAAVEMPTLTA
jgi:hypothetical protein